MDSATGSGRATDNDGHRGCTPCGNARRACSGRASAGGTCVNGQSATNGLRGAECTNGQREAECTNGQVLSTYTSLRERRIYASNAAVQRQAKV